MHTVVLIPAYNPDSAFIPLLEKLHREGLEVLVVNDGSDNQYAPVFEQAAGYARVIGYAKNCGKGFALKAGIRSLVETPGVTGFITADADGQHSVEDIAHLVQLLEEHNEIVLGIRNLSGKIPFRSRVGNDMSRAMYALTTGKYLSDNQSGLRGFPMWTADWLLAVPGNRYEYEMNVLIQAAEKDFVMLETPIQTIYTNGNRTSHFRPLQDTARIQWQLIRNGLPYLALYLCYLTALSLLPSMTGEKALLYCVLTGLALFAVHMFVLELKKQINAAKRRKLCATRHILVLLKYIVVAALFFALVTLGLPAWLAVCLSLLAAALLTGFGSKLFSLIREKNHGEM